MAAEKKGRNVIVIKKIYVNAGHHGGSWKVALADFMTALMAFFLVMWLVGQSDDVKKAVSEHFSTPSIIEYNFQNFGARITLEKLFLDFINQPLQAIKSFLEPMDKSPNVLDFGSESVARAFVADRLTDMLSSGPRTIDIQSDRLEFDIVDTHFFIKGTSDPSPNFGENMQKLASVVKGLEDTYLSLTVALWHQSVAGSDASLATTVANQRLALLLDQIRNVIDSPTVELKGGIAVTSMKDFNEGVMARPSGVIRIRMEQKPQKASGQPFRKLERASDRIFGQRDRSVSVYDNFVRQLAEPQREAPRREDSRPEGSN